MRGTLLIAALLLQACGPWHRSRRLLAPERFVTPDTPLGQQAAVIVATGWADETPSAYRPPEAFEENGTRWMEAAAVTDRGWIEVHPLRPDATLTVWQRPTGWRVDGFTPVVATSGTLKRRIPTAIRWLPSGPLGDEPVRIYMSDLQNIYAGHPMEDGDLLMLEVASPDAAPERYLFRTRRFGWRTRGGAGVLVPIPLPLGDQRDVLVSPALTLSIALGYRFRTRQPTIEFLSERLALVVSAGIGSTALDQEGAIEDQLRGAFNAGLAGGGIELFELASLQVLGNASALFREDRESGWTLAIGLDAVQFGRFAGGAFSRIASEHPHEVDR